jgi:hypothetical protein
MLRWTTTVGSFEGIDPLRGIDPSSSRGPVARGGEEGAGGRRVDPKIAAQRANTGMEGGASRATVLG